jgi:SAM-dependent methyltransferase
MKAAVNRFVSMLTPYRAMTRSAAHLDAQYQRGTWDFMWSLGELGRFSVLAGYCRFLRPGASVLEVGCGEGILQDRLDPASYRRYVGVDIAESAIGRARARTAGRAGSAGPEVEFVTADATTYDPATTFDIIIFNESLEYFEDPLALVRRYEPFLAADGFFIASIYRGPDTVRWRRIWKRLDTAYREHDHTTVTNAAGMSWDLRVLVRRDPL